MSRWSELLKDHAIHDTLKWLRESVSNEFDDLEQDEVPEKRRLLKIISKFEQILSDIDPEIVPFNQLDSLNNGIRNSNIANQIDAFATNGNVAALASASDLLTNHLTVLSLLLSLTNEPKPIKQTEELEKIVDTTTKILINKKDQLSEELSDLSASIQEKENRISELSTAIEKKQEEVSALMSDWQSQFSSAQELRSQEFSKWRDSFTTEKNTDVNDAIASYDAQLQEHTNNFRSKIKNILSDSKDKHQAILDLYEITAGDSVGAGYLQNANIEKKQADKWRRVSVGFIVVTVFWLFFSYFYNTNNNLDHAIKAVKSIAPASTSMPKENNTPKTKEIKPNTTKNNPPLFSGLAWYKLFVTISLSGVLLWGSAYAAQQSTKHRNNEKRTRWFALEVKAIDPFISSLDPEQQKELKKQLCERIFGQSHNSISEETKVIDEHAFSTVADGIAKILSKMPK